MATAPEHVETHTGAQSVTVKPSREAVQKISIEGSTLAVLGVGIALFTMAFGAFTHLSGRMDGLDAKIEKLSSEQCAENREMNGRFDKFNERLDRLFELVLSQGQGTYR